MLIWIFNEFGQGDNRGDFDEDFCGTGKTWLNGNRWRSFDFDCTWQVFSFCIDLDIFPQSNSQREFSSCNWISNTECNWWIRSITIVMICVIANFDYIHSWLPKRTQQPLWFLKIEVNLLGQKVQRIRTRIVFEKAWKLKEGSEYNFFYRFDWRGFFLFRPSSEMEFSETFKNPQEVTKLRIESPFWLSFRRKSQ